MKGRKFGRWRVISTVIRRDGRRFWGCECDCGVLKQVYEQSLKAGRSRSCGCLRKERVSHRRFIHGAAYIPGQSATPEYNAWQNAKRRCYDQNHPRYADWGGRGIAMCARWKDSFPSFLADMGPRPSPKHSLDRYPNNNGNYEPRNCRWGTAKQQVDNRRMKRLENFSTAELQAELNLRKELGI